MKTYSCPDCNVQLNVNRNLVLAAKNSSGVNGIILLSDTLGDYAVHVADSFELNRGEHVDFYCPSCKSHLNHIDDRDLVRLFLKEDDEESVVLFSAIYGENATFHVSKLRQKTYGEQLARFKDPDWYLKLNLKKD